jgi:DNA replication ATP-dependent helicase Dna2
MPQLGKQALSQFIRSGCQRQLALNLYPDNVAFLPERQALNMPYPQSPRPGLRQIQAAGDEWAAEKLHDLTQTFGAASVLGHPHQTPTNQTHYRPIRLDQLVPQAVPIRFLVEAEFPIGASFQTALGITGYSAQFNLQYADLRPDIIAVLPPGTYTQFITPDGTLQSNPPGDTRRQLRVIDIKLTAQASPGYFAEVALYSMALAGWLLDQSLGNDFAVVPDGAVWPGSHEASNLVRYSNQSAQQGIMPTVDQLWQAMQEDLEPVPFEVFALRIRRFLQVEVPQVLSKPWQSLEWHVDSRCSFCEYLGENRPPSPTDPQTAPHPDHCLPTALAQDHLSRVAFISQGARLSLVQGGVSQVSVLAARQPTDQVFDSHQTLRATRTVVAGRAISLQTNQVAIPPQSGTSAGMPRWADLHVYLSVDFDIGSAITVAFGLKAFWREPRPFNSGLNTPHATRGWNAEARVVINRDLNTEQQELLAFLQHIHDILNWCQQQDQAQIRTRNIPPQQQQRWRTKVQFYLWDSLQFDHLTRVVGRHLQAILANSAVNYLAWLFPPEELLPNPDMATRRSPITTIRDVVRSLVAAPIAHYYSLVEVARTYHEANLPANIAAFNIHPLFGTPLSDQIPSERAHEIWSRVTAPRHWQQQMDTYRETVRKRLTALETVTRRLEDDLGNQLSQTAPVINIGPPPRQNRLSVDGQLWYAFAKLNTALEELDVHQIRAMPPHERTARFRSARLPQRLTGTAEQTALAQLGVPPRAGRRVYQLAADSRDVKAKVGDFAVALAPENQTGILDQPIAAVARNTALQGAYGGDAFWRTLMEEGTGVTVAGLDRNLGLIALDVNQRYPNFIDDLHNAGIINLNQDVILDPVHNDFFTRKLLAALQAVGNPQLAGTNPLVRRATGLAGAGSRRSAHTPTADFLWNATAMANTAVARNLLPVRAQLVNHGLNLNPTQWQAWEDALTHRTRLVWGPPGTGKSRTARAIVVGAVLEAHLLRRPLRVLVSAFTYNAIDNVLVSIANDIATLLLGGCATYRVRSRYQAPPGNIGAAIDAELNRSSPSAQIRALLTILQNQTDLVVVGAPPEQVHNLLTCNNGSAQDEWFDLILIDEASQMDVAHAILPLCGVADGGSVVLAGDPLQLPPIHQAEAPVGLEDLVGSVYAFYRQMHQVHESPLGINYRSNETIVAFARHSGYLGTLTSHSPDLRVDLLSPLPTTQPANWPAALNWTPDWCRLLDPAKPATCFVYDDGRSSQRNFFEAEAITALLLLLNGRMANQLRNELHPGTGAPIPLSKIPYTAQEFWDRAVGVVTPHRAQQGLIVSRLQQVFNATGPLAEAIRGAVDTVERFQGQQRDIIIASFALGDPDQIAEEEEFLMSLNRFNVMASRARAKLIVLISREVVDHLASEIEVLRESRLLKVFVEAFCGQSANLTLAYMNNQTGMPTPILGQFRWN